MIIISNACPPKNVAPKACTHSFLSQFLEWELLFTFVKQAYVRIKLQNQRFQNGGQRVWFQRANADVFPVFAVSQRRRCFFKRCFFLHFPRNVRSTFLFLFLSFFNCLDVFSDIYDRFSFQMELTLCGNVAEKWDIKCKQHLVTSIVFVNLPVHTMFPHCFNKLFLYITQLVASPNQENG